MPPTAKESELSIECPSCAGKAVLHQNIRQIPHFGEVMLTRLQCRCGFKYNDVLSLESREGSVFTVKIKGEEALSTKIIRSSSATVHIPELGVVIEPGPASEGYITNIEGLLDRVEAATRVIRNAAHEKEALEAAREALAHIAEARSGKRAFTVIVEDPFGNSALVGKKVKRKILSEKEAAQLKKGISRAEK